MLGFVSVSIWISCGKISERAQVTSDGPRVTSLGAWHYCKYFTINEFRTFTNFYARVVYQNMINSDRNLFKEFNGNETNRLVEEGVGSVQTNFLWFVIELEKSTGEIVCVAGLDVSQEMFDRVSALKIGQKYLFPQNIVDGGAP